MNRLSTKMAAFAEAIENGPKGVRGNATESAKFAGYADAASRTTGHRLLSNPLVIAAREKARARVVEKNDLDVAWVIQKTRDLYNQCLDDHDNTAAARCLDMLGKHVGAFPNKIAIDLSDVPTADMIIGARIRSGLIERPDDWQGPELKLLERLDPEDDDGGI